VTGCVPVSTTGAECPSPSAGVSLTESYGAVQMARICSSPCPAGTGCPDGGQLLGAREDEGELRSRQPDPDDGPGSGDDGVRLDGYTAPLTRSPGDPWHSEEYLLSCLVKLHGWHWLEPRVLKGPWRRPRVHSFMHPEGE